MIGLDGVWKSFSGVPALRGVSVQIQSGDALVLTGPSGAGKTTLLRMIFAGERPDRGELTVAGRNLSKLRASSIPYVRRNIGVVFQDFKLLGERSVFENVAIALEILAMPRAEVKSRVDAVLEKVGLAQHSKSRCATLSGGEQQRTALARAIVGEPPILLCDEPTGNLDPHRAGEILRLLESIHQQGTTLLMCTHDPAVVDFAAANGWRRARLVDGEVLDVDLPLGRPARLDEDTEGFASHPSADETGIIRLHPGMRRQAR